MAATVTWTSLAEREFAAAAEYISGESRAYAAAFVAEALEAIEMLALWPESGAIVPEFEDSEIREIFVKQYRIIYRTTGSDACVIALIHAARDLGNAWKSRSPWLPD